QVIGHQPPRHTAEGPEGILQAAHEGFGRLPISRFAIALAGMAEHHTQHVRPATSALGIHAGGALAKVDLSFFSWRTLQATERQRQGAPQALHKAAHAVVAAAKAVLAEQVLVDTPGAESQIQLGLDDRLPDRADTHAAGSRLRCYCRDL